MSQITTWFTLGAIAMALGTTVLALGFRHVPATNRRRYALLVAVPGIAFVAYGLMALGYGELRTQTGDILYLYRYVDWLLTTPLHVLYLGLLAGAAKRTIASSIGLMGLTIVFGFVGGMIAPPGKWVFFALGSLSFAGVVYYALYDFDRAAGQTDDVTFALYRKLRAFLIVLWLIYPVIWILAPFGIGAMNIATSTLVLSYLDVVAKVGFGLIALSGQMILRETLKPSVTPAD